MSRIEQLMSEKSKPMSTANAGKVVLHTVSRSSILALNKSIDYKIRQNELERTASMNAAAKCIVGGKF